MSYKIKKINKRSERRDYTKVSGELPLPNLIEVQTSTFDWFKKNGIQEVFDEIFPINMHDETGDEQTVLDIDSWEFREPKISIQKAREETKIYDAAIYANLKLLVKTVGIISKENLDAVGNDLGALIKLWLEEKSENKNVTFKKSAAKTYFYELKIKGNNVLDIVQVDIKEETDEEIKVQVTIFKAGEVFLGDFPLMTEAGTFIINGSQKVIVSQLVRSPGAYFKKDQNRKTGEMIYSADIIPSRGTWLEFETESKRGENGIEEVLNVKIDKSRKTTATSLLTAIGFKPDEISTLFDNSPMIKNSYFQDDLSGNTLSDWQHAVQEIYKKIRQGETATADGASKFIIGQLFEKRKYDLTKAGRFKLIQKLALKNRLLGRILAEDIVDNDGNVLVAKDTLVNRENLEKVSTALAGDIMMQQLSFNKDDLEFIKQNQQPDKIQKVRVYRDNDLKTATVTLLGISENNNDFLNAVDILATISYLENLKYGIGDIDDIDHLGNRRVRTVGELLQNQFRIGMIRIEKNVREKLTTTNLFKVKPSTIINNKPLTAIIGEFFNLSQLSQFMDQINPLSELANKRRLTALGPGGLSRDRAGLEVRDVHPSHYGRICPIETPEGPNIGLINNLATYARVNEYGFITTPYRKVIDGVVQEDNVEYFTADEERSHVIIQPNVAFDKDKRLVDKKILARFNGDDLIVNVNEVDYIEVSPKQIFSVATNAIPFLENDDANRALMGSNMQRQAVPLLRPDSPIVGTGIEFEAARDSGSAIVNKEDGIVKYVDAKNIVVESKSGATTYQLASFERSNNGTAIAHTPITKVGDKVDKGEIIADGPSMDKGELAIGQNVVVAFTTYNGYNYEDAIVMSERVIIEDRFTSIHIDEYVIERRNTKLGEEEITREIVNVSDVAKKYLDEDGIIAVGTEVKQGDILVGKVTPKGQQLLSPEDKLLNAIFGEKSRNVKDNSLRVPNGGDGIVQAVKRFSKKDGYDLAADILEVVKVYIVQKRKIQEGDKMSGRHGNKGVISRILPVEDMPHLEDGTPVDILLNPQGVPSRMNVGQVLELHLGMAAKKLGIKVTTPVFEGLNETELDEIMKEANMTNYGKVKLIDGQTGEAMDKPIAVGVMYMLKLSLITQQPLGGKAQNGGQRFGEMEVWALEAYGAAYTLREILTIKSDDIKGRLKTYESIVRSKKIPEPGIPESFNVLTKEIMGLGFNMYMVDEIGKQTAISAYDSESFNEFDDMAYDEDQSGLAVENAIIDREVHGFNDPKDQD